MAETDTIAAVATAPGRGGVAIVRVSGSAAFSIARAMSGRAPEPGRARFVRLDVDECVMLAFKAPASYTGEDVVEFQCHGGSVTPRRVLSECYANGARPAGRGEFTRRAFLNGKIDCRQARAVADLVDAKTAAAADLALDVLSGKAADESRSLYAQALDLSSTLEHALDVDEEDLGPSFWTGVRKAAEALCTSLRGVLARSRKSKIMRDGALVVLAGPPNAGKSSLLNALLGEDRAIVSETPGTTRDSIEAWTEISGWPVRLVDTAGLRETDDAIEAEGVRRAGELVAAADLVIGLDCDAGTRIHSKCDLGRGEGLNVSAKTGEGLDDLKAMIAKRLEEKTRESAECDGAEPDEAFAAACECALAAAERIATGFSPEDDMAVAANAVRTAAERLGSLLGATYSEDVLDRLFSRFCVGK